MWAVELSVKLGNRTVIAPCDKTDFSYYNGQGKFQMSELSFHPMKARIVTDAEDRNPLYLK